MVRRPRGNVTPSVMDERLQVSVDSLNGKFSAKRLHAADIPPDETTASDSIN